VGEGGREGGREGERESARARALFQGTNPMLEGSIIAKLSYCMHQDALAHGQSEAKHPPGLIGSA
jgi:hypothetical protein